MQPAVASRQLVFQSTVDRDCDVIGVGVQRALCGTLGACGVDQCRSHLGRDMRARLRLAGSCNHLVEVVSTVCGCIAKADSNDMSIASNRVSNHVCHLSCIHDSACACVLQDVKEFTLRRSDIDRDRNGPEFLAGHESCQSCLPGVHTHKHPI